MLENMTDQNVISHVEAFARLDEVMGNYGFAQVSSKPDTRDDTQRSEHPSGVKKILKHRPREVHPKASVWKVWKKKTDTAVISVYAAPLAEENWDVNGGVGFLTERFKNGAVSNQFKPIHAFIDGTYINQGGQINVRVSPLSPDKKSETSARSRKHVKSLLKREGYTRDAAPFIGGRNLSETWSLKVSGHVKEIITFNKLDKEHRDMIRHLLSDVKSRRLHGINNDFYTNSETLLYRLVTNFKNEPAPGAE